MIRRVVVVAATAAVVAALIAVADRPGASAATTVCRGADALDFGCHDRRLTQLTEDAGAEAALRDLARGMRRSGYLRGACHQLVHRIGRTAGAEAGMRAFTGGNRLCGSGYYHGVTEAVVLEMGPRDAVREARAVCSGPREAAVKAGAVGEAACLHGMGHGFMHVLERDLRASLRACDALGARGARRECYRGVFMERHADVGRPGRDALRPREPLHPCPALPRRYKAECYGRQTTYALFVHNGDVEAVSRLCATAERAFRSACHRGLGGDVAAETEDVAPLATQARARRGLCRLGRDRRARAACAAGVVGAVLRGGDGDPSAEVEAFCDALDAPAGRSEHAACLRAAGSGYRRLLAQQTAGDAGPIGVDLVCRFKSRGTRRSSR